MILERDDFIKPDTNMDILGGLKPSFEMMGSMAFDEIILNKYNTLEKISHVHTPGNSSGIVDGASAVLIGSEKAPRP
jgi:acetyl-CoA C-acetyltransferase